MDRLRRIRRLVRHFERITDERAARLSEAARRCATIAGRIHHYEEECEACRAWRADALHGHVNLTVRRSADAWHAVLRTRIRSEHEELRGAEAERETRRNDVVEARRNQQMWETLADRRERELEDEGILSAARELDELAMQDRRHGAAGRTFRPLRPGGG